MVIYIVTIWDKGECQLRNVWYYDNQKAAIERIEFEAAKMEGMVKQYDGSYDEDPEDDNNGLIIGYHISPVRSEFEGK